MTRTPSKPTERSPLLGDAAAAAAASSSSSAPAAAATPAMRPSHSTSSSSLASSVPPAHHPSTELLGLAAMTASALFFSVMTALVKYSGAHFPAFEVVFARSILQALFAVAACFLVGVSPLGPKGLRFKLFLRGAAGSFGLGAYFYAIVHMDLGEATVIFFTGPAFTAVFAYFWLREPLSRLDMVSIAACLAGVILVARPAFLFPAITPDPVDGPALYSLLATLSRGNPTDAARGWARVVAILAALTGAVMSACAYVMVRKIAHSCHYLVHVAYFGMVSTVVSGTLMFTYTREGYPRVPSSAAEWLSLLSVGVTAFVGQMLLNRGLQLARAGPGVMMRNLDVVFAFLFGVYLFGEVPHWSSIVGAALIVGTTMATGVSKLVNHRRVLPAGPVAAEDADDEAVSVVVAPPSSRA
ncbi:hypothetical protein H9P43_002286 [Blastocladiella emersonii ATCC 22665]|nr:hypothetical protein H9P43_002286 [Blastocladiella emersonii ATCC 22665]